MCGLLPQVIDGEGWYDCWWSSAIASVCTGEVPGGGNTKRRKRSSGRSEGVSATLHRGVWPRGTPTNAAGFLDWGDRRSMQVY
jgi:hypothetical protein